MMTQEKHGGAPGAEMSDVGAPGPRSLIEGLQQALDLLDAYKDTNLPIEEPVEPLPSLLAQCEELCAQIPQPDPIRTIHQFACTGGTLISKSVALMPQVTLLSEIDPLSLLNIEQNTKMAFAPSDIIYGARTALRPVDAATVEAVFEASVKTLHQALMDIGRHLVIRDHAHSQFCTTVDFDGRPTLREQLLPEFSVQSIVLVRHPLDSYLSLRLNGWCHFLPDTLEEYSRRYLAFLDRHDGLCIFQYEEFVSDPERVMQSVCRALELPFLPGFHGLLGIVQMSGDSGRSSSKIESRPRRTVPEAVRTETASSPCYLQLCERLGYSCDIF
ncbi:MAG TPA: sulfotransferase family protein [Rhodobacteraceae bacterium]|jgi:hypothetical protein|nr:sulfotransferase family protein [Paracoccaceae bacterium]